LLRRRGARGAAWSIIILIIARFLETAATLKLADEIEELLKHIIRDFVDVKFEFVVMDIL
jgi:hypothetical protein